MKCTKCNQDYLDNYPENHTTMKLDDNITLLGWKCHNCNTENWKNVKKK